MILKAIIGGFFSLLILVTLNALYSPVIIRRETAYLSEPLTEACILLKNTTCGTQKIRYVRFEYTAELEQGPLCSTVKDIFCQVNKSLEMIDRAICGSNRLFHIEGSNFLTRKAECYLPAARTTMEEFCPLFRDYVKRLYDRC